MMSNDFFDTSFAEMILLQAGGSSNPLVQFGPLILIVAVFYFFFIRPQSKRQKEQNTFIDELQKGDDIVTTSGIYGKINKIEGDVITVQVDTKTFIRMARTAVSKEFTESANSTTNEAAKKS